MAEPVNLDLEREKRRPGRPLAPATHLDNAAVALINARARLHTLAAAIADIARGVNTELVLVDRHLRHLRPLVTPPSVEVAA